MHELLPSRLWLGHAGDLLKPAIIERASIRAIVQVALAEPVPTFSRELLIAHIPLVDGPGNAPGMVRAAIELTAALIRSATPTLVCCSAGMSRSPAIAAGAIALVEGIEPGEALSRVIEGRPHDVSPALWEIVVGVVGEIPSGTRRGSG